MPPALHSCGFVADPLGVMGAPDEEGCEVFSDQVCTVCKHPPCPCCETFCDKSECIHRDGVCWDTGCKYEQTPRFFRADGSPWTG